MADYSNTPGGQAGDNPDPAVASAIAERFIVAPGTVEGAHGEEDNFRSASGTSFAAPLVSGAAALLRSTWDHLSAPETADILLETADDFCDGYIGIGEENCRLTYGQGRLNVEQAMQPVGETAVPTGQHLDDGAEPLARTAGFAPASFGDALSTG